MGDVVDSVDEFQDHRPLIFSDAEWFPHLTEDAPDQWVAWRVTKSTEPAWWRDLLSAVASYAQHRGVLSTYRKRFAGIPRSDLRDSVSSVQHRSSAAPIWEIANELVVAMYLERALGWTLEGHEPLGHNGRVGDWQFRSATGRAVFVEVKSLVEPERPSTGVHNRGIASERLTAVLRGAYRQLPRGDRATMVVVAGVGSLLDVGHGVMHGDLFQTMFGHMQITVSLADPANTAKLGPSLHNMFTQPKKNRRLGCIAGLRIGGLDLPGLGFYAIHNPFAPAEVRLAKADFDGTRQFWFDENGRGEELDGLPPAHHWATIASSFSSGSSS